MTTSFTPSLLSKMLHFVLSPKQRLALFTAVLLIFLLVPVDFDSFHLHVESDQSAQMVVVPAPLGSTATVTTHGSLVERPW